MKKKYSCHQNLWAVWLSDHDRDRDCCTYASFECGGLDSHALVSASPGSHLLISAQSWLVERLYSSNSFYIALYSIIL
jgi:hypothetical protein